MKNVLKKNCRKNVCKLNLSSLIKLLSKLAFALLLCFFVSCKTAPVFSGTAEMCVLVIDEKNQPVNQMIISCEKNGIEVGRGTTNENGLAVMEAMKGGKYKISGFKSGYEKIAGSEILFSDRISVFCFQTMSGDAVLNDVEACFEKGKYEEGIELLDGLYYEFKDPVSAAVSFYKAYAYGKSENSKAALNELKKVEKNKNVEIDTSELRLLLGVDKK